MAKNPKKSAAKAAVDMPTPRPAMSLGVFRKKRQITFNQRKLKPNETLIAKIVSQISVSKRQFSQEDETGKKKEPPHICQIVEYNDQGEIQHEGEVMEFIVPKILRDTLMENFPGDGYIGKTVAIRHLGKKEGKGGTTYNLFSVDELEGID